jgi:RNase P/RNase MRP subunit p29
MPQPNSNHLIAAHQAESVLKELGKVVVETTKSLYDRNAVIKFYEVPDKIHTLTFQAKDYFSVSISLDDVIHTTMSTGTIQQGGIFPIIKILFADLQKNNFY